MTLDRNFFAQCQIGETKIIILYTSTGQLFTWQMKGNKILPLPFHCCDKPQKTLNMAFNFADHIIPESLCLSVTM